MVIMDNSGAGCSGSSRKRKQPDDEVPPREGPLAEEPIENEYEHLDVDVGVDDDQDEELDARTQEQRKRDHEIAMKAQEPETITHYDGIKVTPFNLVEELEEGEFDKSGNFVFKEKEVLDETNDDTWAESIDWSSVERQQQQSTSRVALNQPEEPEEPEPVVDPIDLYKQLLRMMKSDETVQKTIRRLGNSVPKRRPNKNKFKEPETPEVAEARKKLDLMIELAHKLLESGDMDIYQKSFEQLEEAINS